MLALPLIELYRFLLHPAFQILYGDQALIALGAQKAAHFHQALGPYSRDGFHHPGPFLFYLMAPFAGNIYLGAIVVNALMLVGIVGVSWWRWGAAQALRLAVVTNVIVFFVGASLFREPWNPYLIVVATMLFTVCLVARANLVAVVVGSFIIQSELAAAPFVVAALAASFAIERPRLSRHWLVVVVLWIPSLLEWHNIVDVLTSRGSTSFADALSTMANALVVVPFGNHLYVSHLHHSAVSLVIGLLLLLAGALLAVRQGSDESRKFVLLGAIAVALGAFAFTHNKGDSNPYYAVWLAVVPFSVLAALTFGKLQSGIPEIALVSIVLVAQSAITTGSIGSTIGSGPWPIDHPRNQTAQITERLTQQTLAAVTPTTKHVEFDLPRDADWPYVAGVVWKLQNQGISSTVRPDSYFDAADDSSADVKFLVDPSGPDMKVISH